MLGSFSKKYIYIYLYIFDICGIIFFLLSEGKESSAVSAISSSREEVGLSVDP